MSLKEIHQNADLCGHFLLSLPEKIWSFATDEFCLYENSDPGTLVVDKNYFLARAVHYIRGGNTVVFKTQLFGEKPLLDTIEFIGRRVFCVCATAAAFCTLYPVGFVASALHFQILPIITSISSTPLAKKISEIWDDASLFGHALTSAPSSFYTFAAAPLSWHLRPDGTDRRNYRAIIRPDGIVEEFQSEYELVPFELFEIIYRRVFGSTMMVASGIVSPIGLVAKSLHLVARDYFSETAPI